jgi:hypothetical protein
MKKIILFVAPLATLIGLWRLSGPAIAIVAAALVAGAVAWIQRLLATTPKGLFTKPTCRVRARAVLARSPGGWLLSVA